MEDRLNIILRNSCGTLMHISPRRSNTLREIVRDAQIYPTQCKPFCILRGNKVHMDLSLASLNIRDGETITIMIPKEKKRTKLIDQIDYRKKQIERLDGEVYNEVLRVSDFQYKAFELYKKAPAVYQQMYQQQKNKEETLEGKEEIITFIGDAPTNISEEPLPICWENESDNIDRPIFRKKSTRKAKKL